MSRSAGAPSVGRGGGDAAMTIGHVGRDGIGGAPRRRFVLCTTPAQGHTAPLVAVAGRLVAEGHEVVFFTTEHYRRTVEATGARFVPFAAEDDAHDLMVANPERESSSKRGVRGVKDDLRRIFIGPLPGQCRDLRAILDDFAPTASSSTPCSSAPCPWRLGLRLERPALACIGVMPYSANSRDTAPFGVAFQPGAGPLRRLRNIAMNWATEHFVLADIQRFARHRLAEAGVAGGFPATSSTSSPRWSTPSCRRRWRASNTRARISPRRCASSGPSCPADGGLRAARLVGRAGGGRAVIHVTQGTLDNADLGRLLLVTTAHPRPRRRARRGHDRRARPRTAAPRLPGNVRLERFVPHDLLLPHVDVMVTNGGYGGVQQALANGVPLVVAGDSEDKPEVAAHVQWSGAGVTCTRASRRPPWWTGGPPGADAGLLPPAGTGSSRPRSPPPTRSAPSARAGGALCGQRPGPPPRERLTLPAGEVLGRAGPAEQVDIDGMQAEPTSGPLSLAEGDTTAPLRTRSPTRGCWRTCRPRAAPGALPPPLRPRPGSRRPFVAELRERHEGPRQLMEWLIHRRNGATRRP